MISHATHVFSPDAYPYKDGVFTGLRASIATHSLFPFRSAQPCLGGHEHPSLHPAFSKPAFLPRSFFLSLDGSTFSFLDVSLHTEKKRLSSPHYLRSIHDVDLKMGSVHHLSRRTRPFESRE
ncbi:hypothetical protein NPIL_359411 [Nephila pilipes]|uniref:Uncharacterized protein n=1 Tax=Nephila pilipes TaxID=299642 RepID=A0A8X6N986_NEPPI|nr:hypothetical protein NPIL_359411 [Nephila pilipes]